MNSHADPAPRLAADELIARHITRVGRFRRIDPLRGRQRPTVPRILGALGWAVLVEESFRRARRGASTGA